MTEFPFAYLIPGQVTPKDSPMLPRAATVFSVSLLAAAGAAARVASFEPLGVFTHPSSQGPSSYAAAVSADGAVVCGQSYTYD